MCCGEVGSLSAGVVRVQLEPGQVELAPESSSGMIGGVVIGVDGNRGELFWGFADESSDAAGWVVSGAVQLTLTETRLAWALLCNAGVLVSRESLLDHVWVDSQVDTVQAVYTCVNRLQQKSLAAGLLRWWQVKRDFGYWVEGKVLSRTA